jgi:hypothetical protein
LQIHSSLSGGFPPERVALTAAPEAEARALAP